MCETRLWQWSAALSAKACGHICHQGLAALAATRCRTRRCLAGRLLNAIACPMIHTTAPKTTRTVVYLVRACWFAHCPTLLPLSGLASSSHIILCKVGWSPCWPRARTITCCVRGGVRACAVCVCVRACVYASVCVLVCFCVVRCPVLRLGATRPSM